MNFYTNVTRHRNQILVRGISDGKPVKFSVKYKPYLFVQASAQTEHKNLKGEYVGKMQFDSMSETREFLQSYENVAGMNIYGLSDWPYMYIYDKYKGEIKYDPALVSVCSIDIETSIEGGFPDIEKADNEITAITIGRNGRKTTFGCGEYKEHQDNVQYYKCADESALLLAFLEVWNGSLYSPDVVTGWTSSSSISHILSTGFEKFLDLITLNASLPGKCYVNTKLTAVDETVYATRLSVSQSSITSSSTGSLRTQSRNLTDLTTSLKLSSAKESLTTAMKVIPTSTTFG